jgi:hypothetical protein
VNIGEWWHMQAPRINYFMLRIFSMLVVCHSTQQVVHLKNYEKKAKAFEITGDTRS